MHPQSKSLLPVVLLLAVPVAGCLGPFKDVGNLDDSGGSSAGESDTATSTSTSGGSTSTSGGSTSTSGGSTSTSGGSTSTSGGSASTSDNEGSGPATTSTTAEPGESGSESAGEGACTPEEHSEEDENTYPNATTCDLPLDDAIYATGLLLDDTLGSYGDAFSLSEDCIVSGVFPSAFDGYTEIVLNCTSGGQPTERVIDGPFSQSVEVYAAPGSSVHLERVVEGPAGSLLSNGWIGLYDASDELIVGGAVFGVHDSFNAPAACAEGDPSCAFFRPLTVEGPEEICPLETPHVCASPCFDTQRMGVSVAIDDAVTIVGDQRVGSVTNGAGYAYDITVGMAKKYFGQGRNCNTSPGAYRYVISRVPPEG